MTQKKSIIACKKDSYITPEKKSKMLIPYAVLCELTHRCPLSYPVGGSASFVLSTVQPSCSKASRSTSHKIGSYTWREPWRRLGRRLGSRLGPRLWRSPPCGPGGQRSHRKSQCLKTERGEEYFPVAREEDVSRRLYLGVETEYFPSRTLDCHWSNH